MPNKINPIKLAKYKKSRYEGKSIEASLLAAGQSPKTARHKANSKVGLAKVGEEKIRIEVDKKQLAEKAYQTLEDCLKSKRRSDKIAAAQNILRFTDGEKLNTKVFTTKEEEQEYSELRKRFNPIELCKN